jgi:uncharacterized protein YlxW (UPF0749 family)
VTGTRPPVEPHGGVSRASAQLLLDLVNNTLDPGYAAAARRRGAAPPPRRWYDRSAVVIGCLLVGFVLVLAYLHTHRSAPETDKVHAELVQRVRAAQAANDRLDGRASALERQLAELQRTALANAGALPAALALDQLAAGQVAVAGPGLTVTLREAPTPSAPPTAGRAGSTPIQATNILTDRDVRSVVNELWNDGAEAISVNNVRLNPTSAIRFAGQAVLVDFQPITSPYRVQAIGDPDILATNFAQSAVASRYQTLIGVDHIGFQFSESKHLELPASTAVTPRYATVPGRPR